ncbi:MAG: ABC transporter permease subunit [Planctomycetaceae bacterium]|nr:ABC transporter permease subunit [Planctomycetaceae bacterium]
MANPVLQRELVAHLRSPRSFALQAAFLALLGALVTVAWPATERIQATNFSAARQLVELLFAGQFLLASLTAPAFAAGALTGEKERKTYELLLASALRPAQIVWGKWAGAFVPSVLLVVSTLPIVVLCLPLGGVSVYEVAAAYLTLLAALACFTMVSLVCSAWFPRTTAALVSSYLMILPPALLGVGLWYWLDRISAEYRLIGFLVVVPLAAAVACAIMFAAVARRLRYPPDVGGEGRDVVDERRELHEAVGLIIQRDQFPDRLFAPPKRTDLLPEGANPVLDKELRSELFSQGTLMMRLVIQISLLLAVPLMGAFLYFRPLWAPWYIGYVLLFNMLVGPVFSAAAVAGERERRTLDLLLVTTLRPASIVWGKLFGGLRVAGVLTSFLLWPVVLAWLFVPEYHANLPTFAAYLAIVAVTCAVTSVIALACSVVFTKSTTSLTTAYLAVVALFLLPPAADAFVQAYLPATEAARIVHRLTIASPFSAAFHLPLDLGDGPASVRPAEWPLVGGYFGFQITLLLILLILMMRAFRLRYAAASGLS